MKKEELESVVFSIKLINGMNVLSELHFGSFDGGGQLEQHFIMKNPVVIRLSGSTTSAEEFDFMSNEKDFAVAWENVISQPTVASDFFREFYVRSLIFMFGRELKEKMSIDNISPLELNSLINSSNEKMNKFIDVMSLKFNIELEKIPHESKPSNVVLH